MDPPPAADLPSAAGTYLLVMHAPRDFEPVVGGLGRLALRRGWYCYTGSALGSGGLAARCGRHIRSAKTPRWHIDHLRRHLRLWAVWYAVGARCFEHEWAGALETRSDMLTEFHQEVSVKQQAARFYTGIFNRD